MEELKKQLDAISKKGATPAPDVKKPKAAKVEVEAKPKSEAPAGASGHCMKCKANRKMLNPTKTTSKNGRPMLRGKCPECGRDICKFIKKSDA